MTTRVYFEKGKHSVFAAAIDWPGWCRHAKTEDVGTRGIARLPGSLRRRAVSALQARDSSSSSVRSPATPPRISARRPWTHRGTPRRSRHVISNAKSRCWKTAGRTSTASSTTAPATLTKGPRGGGRDRDGVVAHTREAERHYCSKLGTRVPPRTPWVDQRAVVVESLLAGSPDAKWPPRYSIRRLAWHVLDHAWEIQDKSA